MSEAAPRFAAAHACHPELSMALGLALASLAPRAPAAPTLGWCYLSDHHGAQAEAALAALGRAHPGVSWVGAVAAGVCAEGVEYLDEPAVVLMLCDLPRAQFRVFSGRRPLQAEAGFVPHAAQVHADPATSDLPGLLAELAARVGEGGLFGGLSSARGRALSFAEGLCPGGLGGVAFSAGAAPQAGLSQGCTPLGPMRTITAGKRQLVQTLDGHPALDCLIQDLGLDPDHPRAAALALRRTLVALTDAPPAGGGGAGPSRWGAGQRVRHLIGLDPAGRALAVADHIEPGQRLAFCRRDAEAARRDLMRLGAELRSTLEPEELPLDGRPTVGGRRLVAALYASCTGRGGPHFGAPSAELQLLRHGLGGDPAGPGLPLAGFFAAGEIAGRHLYGHTGVLAAFTAPA